ncbi:MAG: deoxyribose-phosphate aldolase [Pseudomonadota bacterium]
MDRKTIAERSLGLIDLTNLDDDCSSADIDDLCARAQTPFGNTAAVCVWPRFVAQSVGLLEGTDIDVATVVNFPTGDGDIKQVMHEAKAVVADGATEVDLVMPYKALMAGEIDTVEQMISTIRAVTDNRAALKVIIESGELDDDALITQASKLSLEEGANFIKTSTGKVAQNATLQSAKLILMAIKDFGDTTRGFKTSGGIKSVEGCGEFLALADKFMGPLWVGKSTFRFGASRVLSDVLAALEGEHSAPVEGY